MRKRIIMLVSALLCLIVVLAGCGEEKAEKLNSKYRKDITAFGICYNDGSEKFYRVLVTSEKDDGRCWFTYYEKNEDEVSCEFTLKATDSVRKLILDKEELKPYSEVVDENGKITKEDWHEGTCVVFIENDSTCTYFRAPSNIDEIEKEFAKLLDNARK